MLADAYIPRRDIVAKAQRRLTQWRAARPAMLSFDKPILSLCFDDFPRSAALEGARILEAHGGRGTFYASAALAGQDTPCGPAFVAEDLTRLRLAGHEIGCHSYAHSDCARLSAYDALQELARNRDALAELGHDAPLSSLAYPYGETSWELKESLPPRLRTARGILPGLNVDRTDLAQLRAYPLYGTAMAQAHEALMVAAERNAWMIVFTHDVGAAPSPWGIATDTLDVFLSAARMAGLTLMPVTAALENARA